MLTFLCAYLKRILRYLFLLHYIKWHEMRLIFSKKSRVYGSYDMCFIYTLCQQYLEKKSLMFGLSLHAENPFHIIIEVIKCNSYCRKLSVEVNVNENNGKASNNTILLSFLLLPSCSFVDGTAYFPTSFNVEQKNIAMQ